MSGSIAFHFDFISPYSYLAWTQIRALAARHAREVVPVPTLLAALLAHGKTKGPAEIPAKRTYLLFDTLRIAKVLGVPIRPPASHPFNPLLALRAASLDASVIDPIFEATWANGERVDTEEALSKIIDPDLVKRATTDEAKNKLRARTDAAIARGVFGVPTMILEDDGAMFWGTDSLPHLERHLSGDKLDLADEMKKWSSVPATAARKI